MFPLLRSLLSLLLVCGLLGGCVSTRLATAAESPWQAIPLNTRSSALDLAFSDENHGILVGSNRLVLETDDGGKSWQERNLDLPAEENFRLISIDFAGDEGWIAGQPGLVLHSTDTGRTWRRLRLTGKLPGEPYLVTALGPDQAELATTVGAIYRTDDGGGHWTALVEDATGAVRDLRREKTGGYVSVSSLGNFYADWRPGEAVWTPHQRPSSQRVQAMGFTPSGHLWMVNRGAQIRFPDPESTPTDTGDPAFGDAVIPITNGYGYLDLAWAPDGSIWLGGGNGTLLSSQDGGSTWLRDPVGQQQPSTFTRILFVGDGKGFVLGERGNLLRWIG
ncbi:MAG: photosynthesis system II assembly factor Ycf48 [Synechococcus sp. SB0668_bin_13]|uniref:Photosystem II assembly lipoprotein Ycf48 n=1 Tax=Synechococcus sp. SB0676_bin_10 TaxID=2604869 RepID=A0A6B1F801_9SYNE|nr:photosynthesis system II assembly factor Ycf48 [Cyanobacteria bacterium MAG IRC3_bin_20]MDE0648148.1 photosynthesis system II assembly factor Ycf48 [Cyanobacteria bacterium MAG IRC4_bin_6]MXW13065.1 photosynthesis system II assembly factor Ycf48 [Synechococcus sp. SB0668_bin_13]MXY18652.1 photosynthesis system II assembly factor Ycf48 [Synechococcus sp. SB0664_bin_36]MYG37885.1 photosynthesis system II assembly factor Ycf48 [Synechococcus sp. SB0676_bin_10]MYK06935.1 photosynthesis system I